MPSLGSKKKGEKKRGREEKRREGRGKEGRGGERNYRKQSSTAVLRVECYLLN